MEERNGMKLYSLEECLDEHYGKIGTPARDAFERKVNESLYAYRIGEAIKNARINKKMTQEQLGEKVGVKKSQISHIEHGYSITIPTMSKLFCALGISTATLDLGVAGKVALW
ncbi:MAG: helix-turn-helix domain-containing protein [Prevotellaceae bacterium]|nr:helix-turn-helix domain-containing protein [Prevotellaceae bacterium]